MCIPAQISTGSQATMLGNQSNQYTLHGTKQEGNTNSLLQIKVI